MRTITLTRLHLRYETTEEVWKLSCICSLHRKKGDPVDNLAEVLNRERHLFGRPLLYYYTPLPIRTPLWILDQIFLEGLKSAI